MRRSRVEKRPLASRDVVEIALYLAEESGSEEIAARFLDAAESSFEQLSVMPEVGATRSDASGTIPDLRMWPVSGFRSHLVFYRLTPTGVEIVRVLHAKRDTRAILDAMT